MDNLIHVIASNALVALLLAIPAAAVSYGLRKPALAHGLWLLVLLKLVTPPLWNVAISLPARELVAISVQPAAVPVDDTDAEVSDPDLTVLEEPVAIKLPIEAAPISDPSVMTADVSNTEPEPAEEIASTTPESAASFWATIDWPITLGSLWFLGSAACVFLVVVRLARFRRLTGYAELAPRSLQEEADRLALALGLRRCPPVWLVPGRVSPMLCALGGWPRLLLPADLLGRLDHGGRQALLVHELAHYRRGDHWLRWFELAVSVVYWWHPIVWWARHEMQEAEEQCCDAWVVWALPGQARSYATALVETIDFLGDASPVLPPMASGLGYIHDLKRRLTMIMRGTPPRALTWSGVAGLFGLGAFLLPLVPTLAQEREKPRTEPPAREAGQEEQQQPPRDERRTGDARPGGDEAAKLEAEIRKMRDQMEGMMQQLQKAEMRLVELRGGNARGPQPGAPGFLGTPGAGAGRAGPGFPGVGGAPGAPGGVPPGAGPGSGAPGAPGGFGGGAGGAGGRTPTGPGIGGPPQGGGFGGAVGGRGMPGPGGGMMGGPNQGDRLAQIEQKLEMVMRALEEIRQRDMQQRGPGDRTPPNPSQPNRPGAGGRDGAGAPPAERFRGPGGPGNDPRRSDEGGRPGAAPPAPPTPPPPPATRGGSGDAGGRPGRNADNDNRPTPPRGGSDTPPAERSER